MKIPVYIIVPAFEPAFLISPWYSSVLFHFIFDDWSFWLKNDPKKSISIIVSARFWQLFFISQPWISLQYHQKDQFAQQ